MADGPADVETSLKKLRAKASLMQFCHARLAERSLRRYNLFSIIIVIASGICTVLIFGDFEYLGSMAAFRAEQIRFYAGCLSVIVFVLSEVVRRFDWPARGNAHHQALEGYTAFLRNAQFLLHDEQASLPEDEFIGRANELKQKYLEVGLTAPKIPTGHAFLTLKRKHLITVRLSKALDADPGPGFGWHVFVFGGEGPRPFSRAVRLLLTRAARTHGNNLDRAPRFAALGLHGHR